MTNAAIAGRGSTRPSVGTRAFDALDIAATALFGLEGAAAAAHAGFDLLGVVVVGLIVALAGGVLRDVLLGDLPPAALRTPSRIVAGLAGALVAFVFIEIVDAFPVLPLQILDAIGLALFAVTGAQKAWASGANLWVVTILGTLAATGGGVIRDVLLARTPYVLSESIYGTAAAAGAVVTGILLAVTGRPRLALGAGFAVALALRLGAVVWGWSLPRIA
ncbi:MULTISPECIES: trimeric intracellular cation channel family protein [Microbacterium]|uniref:trimeric intracellular cation channel family protein n=1 Tax=Microbacterium TaxID=33882 RepID=UPI002784186A|nr:MULTISPECIES: TRIC cation channel family protein [Microbacterium]MDQ1076464.1 putative membrane protein YeiH [Microbacterium sp. SORGH_AS_0969]MDQ1116700.1 putative membrane protein YeiH [Microbacterium testaceum]